MALSDSQLVAARQEIDRLASASAPRASQAAQTETLQQGEIVDQVGVGLYRVRLLDAGGNATAIVRAQSNSPAELPAGAAVSLRMSAMRKVPLIVSGGGGQGSVWDWGVLAD